MLGCHVAVQEDRNHMAAQQPDSQPAHGEPQPPSPVAGDTQWRNVYVMGTAHIINTQVEEPTTPTTQFIQMDEETQVNS